MRAKNCVSLVVAVALVLSVLGPGLAFGDLIASDSFNYAGGSSLNGANGGMGWSDAWNSGESVPTIGSSGLTYTGVASVGNCVNATAGGWALRSLSNPIGGSDETVWISFLAHGVTPQTLTGWGGVSLYHDGWQEGEGFSKIVAGGTSRWGLQKVGGGPYQSGVPDNATTVFYVAEVLFGQGSGGNDKIHVWMNPNPSVVPSVYSTDIDGETSHYVINGIGIGGSADAGLTFDELRIGTTYIDVVPEPSTIVLLATGLIGLLAYAWRKRK